MQPEDWRILLVAVNRPELLFVSREVEAIVNSGLNVTLLQSPATVERITDVLRSAEQAGNPFNMWWICSHAVGEPSDPPDQIGILLDGDELFDLSTLSQLANAYKPLGAIINTCKSLTLAHEIWSRSGVSVVCTIVNVPDRMAFTTGRLLAERLSEHGDLRQAYEDSRPGANRVYVYLPGESLGSMEDAEGDSRMRSTQPGARAANLRSAGDMADIVENLVRSLQGDPFNRTTGLIEQMSILNQTLRESSASDHEWKRATEERFKRVEAEQELLRRKTEEINKNVDLISRDRVGSQNASAILGARWWVLVAFMLALVGGEFVLILALLRFTEALAK